MSLNDYKITQGDIASKGVQAAPDVLSGSPAENKAIFDRLISEAVAVQFNALIDKLVENGAEAILRRGDDSVLYLRLNADKVLEVSTDGKEYFSTVGSGHIIVDKYGKDMPKGLRLKFDNFEVREENGTIIVHGVAEEIAGAIPNTEKGAPNGVATLDAYGCVVQPQQWQSNPNLLHNWYFGNPVNQRGKTTYDEAGYTIDRWSIASASSLTVLDDCIEITGSIHQTADIGGGYFGVPLTLSVLDTENNLYVMEGFTLTSLNQGTSSSAQGAPLLSAFADTDERIAVSVAPSRNSTIRLRAVKLEFGTQQTLAHQDADGKWVLNEIPNKGEELIRCQSAPVGFDGSGGVAPAGYGLGKVSTTAVDANTKLANGYFRTTSATENISFTHGAGHVRTYSGSEVVQNIGNAITGAEMVRRTVDGGATWIEEYVNPNMIVGVEYRTTKRWKNKTVYTTLLVWDTLPVETASTGALLPNGSKATDWCPLSVYFRTSDGRACIAPLVEWSNGTTIMANVRTTDTGVYIRNYTDVSIYTAYCIAEYTKD